MKFNVLIFLLFLSNTYCDLLDEQFYVYLVFNALAPSSQGLEPPQFVRIATLGSNYAYDAIAPYLPKAVGIYSRIPRRPVNERTDRNKNIAIAYAIYRGSENSLPNAIPKLNMIFQSVGLDPLNKSMDLNTPIGIGNYAAMMVIKYTDHDGMNQLGDMNRKKYNLQPYEDYTNYSPVNTAYELKYPGRWQPNIEYFENGVYFVQQHIFTQYGRVKPYAIKNVNDFKLQPPRKSNPRNRRDYKKQVDEILYNSAHLNDYKKMSAEHFDIKGLSLGVPIFWLVDKYNGTQDDIIIVSHLAHIATHDAGIIAWKEKIVHDAVRPFSAVKYLYKNKKLCAWGGPGKGTVHDITGNEWRSYIRTAAHSDYPSGSACFCSSQFRALERYYKTKEFGYSVVKQKGSSFIEKNITPSTDIKLGPYKTFDDYVDECAMSRVWGGVHFKSAIEVGKRLCRPVGDIVYDYFMKHVNGMV